LIVPRGQTYELLSLVDPSKQYFYSPAVDLNDNGQILVRGCTQSYFDDCYALALQPVPEPSTWAMLLTGLVTVAWLRRTQKA
jgi:hypothetical protein